MTVNVLLFRNSSMSLKMHSKYRLIQLFDHVSLHHFHDSIRNVDKRYQEIADASVRVSRFLLTDVRYDDVLTVYSKRGSGHLQGRSTFTAILVQCKERDSFSNQTGPTQLCPSQILPKPELFLLKYI